MWFVDWDFSVAPQCLNYDSVLWHILLYIKRLRFLQCELELVDLHFAALRFYLYFVYLFSPYLKENKVFATMNNLSLIYCTYNALKKKKIYSLSTFIVLKTFLELRSKTVFSWSMKKKQQLRNPKLIWKEDSRFSKLYCLSHSDRKWPLVRTWKTHIHSWDSQKITQQCARLHEEWGLFDHRQEKPPTHRSAPLLNTQSSYLHPLLRWNPRCHC